ncbi:MAG: helix-turn-helix transcriptional regulator [Bacteroidales bacterium]
MESKNNNFEALLSGETSGWRTKARDRKQNKEWRRIVGEIAVSILKFLKENGLTQVELAKRLDVSPQYVSKIVQGKENLSIETICKIQLALGIQLIAIPAYHSTIRIEPVISQINNYRNKRTVYSGSVQSEADYKNSTIVA